MTGGHTPSATDATAETARTDGTHAPVDYVAPASFGRYEVLAELGRGATGVVHEARDPALSRVVAIKSLHPGRLNATQMARIRAEAVALAQLSHPNVVPIYDVGEDNGITFIVMELVPGGTLRRWLRERRSRREVISTLIAAGRGLQAAHDLDLVHRDFKPDNVLVDDRGTPRVVDFGLVRASGSSSAASMDPLEESDDLVATLTSTGELVGTPAYMAPEQLEGKPVDARADQFAFCVALYEALEGQRPFGGSTFGELLATVQHADREMLGRRSAVPRAVLAVLRRGLAAAPDDRFPDMGALLDELQRVARSTPWTWVAVPAVLGATAWAVASGAPAARPPAPEPAPVAAPVEPAPVPAVLQDRFAEIAALERAGDMPGMLAAADAAFDAAEEPGHRARARLYRAWALVGSAAPAQEVLDAAAQAYALAVDADAAAAMVEAAVLALAEGEEGMGDDQADRLRSASAFAEAADAPDAVHAYLELGYGALRLQESDFVGAAERLGKGLALTDRNAFALRGILGVRFGLALLLAGRNDEGLAQIGATRDELVSVLGAAHPYTILAALTYTRELGRHDRGEQAFAELEALEAASATAQPRIEALQVKVRFLRASVLYDAGRYADALEALEVAIDYLERSGQEPDVHANMRYQLAGSIYSQLGRFEDAHRESQKLSDLLTARYGPDSSVAMSGLLRLAESGVSSGKLDEAQADLEELLERAPSDSVIWLMARRGLAHIAYQREDFSRSAALLAEVVDSIEEFRGPGYAGNTRTLYAVTLAELGRRDEATAEFERAIEQLKAAGPAWWKQLEDAEKALAEHRR